MARFRATMKGARGAASRLGTPFSGIVAAVNGWDAGVSVFASAEGDADVFSVNVTGGSNADRGPREFLRIEYRDGVTTVRVRRRGKLVKFHEEGAK